MLVDILLVHNCLVGCLLVRILLVKIFIMKYLIIIVPPVVSGQSWYLLSKIKQQHHWYNKHDMNFTPNPSIAGRMGGFKSRREALQALHKDFINVKKELQLTKYDYHGANKEGYWATLNAKGNNQNNINSMRMQSSI